MRIALILLCVSLLSLTAGAQSPTPFSCSGTDGFGYYISSATVNNGTTTLTYGNSRLSKLTTATGDRTELCSAAQIGVSLNGLAYNPNDKYLYAVSRFDATNFSGKLYRLGENCGRTEIPVSGPIVKYTTNNKTTVDNGGGAIGSGTFDLEGNYYVNTSFTVASKTGFTNKIQKINISGNTATVVSTATLTCSSCTGNRLQINDIIFDETSGKLYGSDRTSVKLYSIDATSGAVTPIGSTGAQDAILGLYKNRFGEVRAIDGSGQIYSVNLSSGVFTPLSVATDLFSSNADAASGCYSPTSISGTLFLDGNGATDNTVNGTPTNKAGSVTLYANLVQNNLIAGAVPIGTDGLYEFLGDFSGSYQVRIGRIQGTVGQAPPNQSLPNTHRYVSEFVGSGQGLENSSPNGRLSFTMTLGTDRPNVNFGIDTRPIAQNVSETAQVNPGGNDRIRVPALLVTDAEDGIPTTITVVSIPDGPTGGVLYYNNTAVVANQRIDNFQASLFEFDPVDGLQTVSFTYLARDQANVASNTATVTMEFSSTLPLTLVSFTATYDDGAAHLHWETSVEVDVDHFEIQRSLTGGAFTEIGRVSATGNSTSLVSYTYVDEQPVAAAYYRLVSVDLDGSVDYSNTVYLKGRAQPTVSVYPTLATDNITVRAQGTPKQPLRIAVFDATGKLVRSDLLLENTREIDVSELPSGLYTVRVTIGNRILVSAHKVMKR